MSEEYRLHLLVPLGLAGVFVASLVAAFRSNSKCMLTYSLKR